MECVEINTVKPLLLDHCMIARQNMIKIKKWKTTHAHTIVPMYETDSLSQMFPSFV